MTSAKLPFARRPSDGAEEPPTALIAKYQPAASHCTRSDVARATYRHFVGHGWERFGETVWMGPWRRIWCREAGANRDIVAELRGLRDVDARPLVPMILDDVDHAAQARAALAAVYDDPAVSALEVFALGDGESKSGLLIAGHCAAVAVATCLVVLLD